MRRISARAAINRDSLPVARFVCERRIVGVIGNVEFEKTVVVKISEGAAGAPLRVGDVRILRDIGKGGIAVVAVKNVRPEICEVEIGVAIVIVIAGRRANAVAGVADACRVGNIGESAIAVVMIENVLRKPFRIRFGQLWARVDEVYVQKTVVIVIKKTAA